MTHKASQELADILLGNGFKDISANEHPNSLGRRFRLNGVTVYFDPYEIHLFATCDSYKIGYEITEEQIRAIIYIAKNHRIPSKYHTLGEELQRVLSEYRDIQRHPHIFTGKRAIALKGKLESLSI